LIWLLGRIPSVLPARQWRVAFAGTGLLLVALYCIKHYFAFSLSNATLLLFMPLGPLVIGFALKMILIPHEREPLSGLWGAVFVVWCLLVFGADQYFAYVHDGQGVGFGSWYSWIVENRGFVIKPRGRAPTSFDRVGGFGYVLELVKIAGILYPGWSILREDRQLSW
jgi:hypothetical protein